MHKFFIVLFVFFLPCIVFSQKLDSLIKANKNDSIIHYQYRISLDNITTLEVSKIMSPQLFDMFHKSPNFYEQINQYIVESDMNVEKRDLEAMLSNTDYKVKYFKKIRLLTNGY